MSRVPDMRGWLRYLLPGALLVALLAPMVAAGAPHETVQLRHRTADEVVPLLRPFLAPGGAMTGQGYKLFIRTSPENLRELKRILADIDTGLRQLLISVSMDAATTRSSQGIEVSGRAGGDSVTVGAGDSDEALSLRLQGNRQHTTAPATYQVKSSEGQWATIGTGTAYPVRTRVRTAQGTEIERVEMVSANTGFQVLPRVNGEQVTLRIRPYRSRAPQTSRGAIDYTEMDTVVRGRLGNWIPIGSATSAGTTRNQTLTGAASESSALSQGMAVKVELIDRP